MEPRNWRRLTLSVRTDKVWMPCRCYLVSAVFALFLTASEVGKSRWLVACCRLAQDYRGYLGKADDDQRFHWTRQ